ncbi:hypothetical protein SEEM842_04400 [Salmonella enterica subsp. enterica serovar Senftenberg str. 423984-2]|nr:hypothetical protein SEEM842_04400 [Salmonella enterica subsp. enterica serovar Senftenberg str. 423984-2]
MTAIMMFEISRLYDLRDAIIDMATLKHIVNESYLYDRFSMKKGFAIIIIKQSTAVI